MFHHKSDVSGLSRAGETLTCAQTTLFTMFQALFFKDAALGRPKVCNCRQTDFSKTFFSFFHHLKHPLFRAANLSKMRLSLHTVVLLEGGCEFCPLPGGLREVFL